MMQYQCTVTVICILCRISEHSLQVLLGKYPHNANTDVKAQHAAAHLQLEGPTDGKRKFFVGPVMPGLYVIFISQYWFPVSHI